MAPRRRRRHARHLPRPRGLPRRTGTTLPGRVDRHRADLRRHLLEVFRYQRDRAVKSGPRE